MPLLHIDPRAPGIRPHQLQDAPPVPAAPPAPRPGGRADASDANGQEQMPGVQGQPQRHAALMLDNPAHENHIMFAALLRTVNERDAQAGRTPDELSRQVAGGLTQEARLRGLGAIGAAQFTADGTKVGMTDTADLSHLGRKPPWAMSVNLQARRWRRAARTLQRSTNSNRWSRAFGSQRKRKRCKALKTRHRRVRGWFEYRVGGT